MATNKDDKKVVEETDKNTKDSINEDIVTNVTNLQESQQQDLNNILQQIDNAVNTLGSGVKTNKSVNVVQVNENENVNNSTTNNNSNQSHTSTQSAMNDGLKVRIVKKLDFEGDIQASLRDPMASSSEIRIVEKNDLETDVIADLREPEYEHKDERPQTNYEVAPKEIVPEMTISSVVVEEGSTAIFDVVLSKALTTPYTVTFNTSTNGSAEPTDINPSIVVKDSKGNVINPNSDGSYTVPPGEQNLKVEVKTTDDNIYEGSETFELNGKTEFTDTNTQGTGTIKDNGTAPDGDDVNDIGPDLDPATSDDDSPKMTINDVIVEEGSKAIFAITLDKVAEIPYKVYFNLSNNTTSNNDYNSTFVVKDSNGNVINPNGDGSYTVPPGEQNLKVEVSTTDDNVYEISESFKLNGKTEFMDSYTNGTGTILDDGTATDGDDSGNDIDNDKPTLIFSDATMEEGSTLVFNGSLSNPTAFNEEITLSATFGSASDSAGNTDINNDRSSWTVTYNNGANTINVATDGTFTLPAGVTDFKVNIPTTTDNIYEGAENFTLNGDATSTYITDSDTAIGTITDDGSGSDGDDDTDGTNDGTDNDGSVDDDRPQMTIGDIIVEEGSGATFAVTVGEAKASYTVTFSLSTENIVSGTDTLSAENNDITNGDIVINGQTISPVNGIYSYTVSAGTTSFDVTVPTISDNIYEGKESFYLLGKTEFMSANTHGTGYITDYGATNPDDSNDKTVDGDDNSGTGSNDTDNESIDDDRPTLTLDDATMEEGSTLVFVGSLSNATEYDEVITLSATFGSASDSAENTDINNDRSSWTVTYNNGANTINVASDGTFTLPAGIIDFKVNIPTTSDNVYEGAEKFTLNADATSNYITDSDTAIGTIIDDGSGSDGDDSDSSVDDDRTKFSINDQTVYEGANSTITFTVTRVGDAEANQTVDYAVTIESGDTAEDGDFTVNDPLTGTLTFAPGEFTKTITLNAPVDADADEETFTVTLSNNSAGSTIIDGIGIGTIKESNTPPEGTDKTIALAKNTSDVLEASDFGYSDVDGDAFAGIKITTLESVGSLLHFDGTSWNNVTLNQEISKADIDNGYLVFKPTINGVGTGYDSFQFEVSDGTAYDSTPNTITYNIQNTLSVSDPLPVDETNSAVFVIRLDEARTQNTVLDLTTGGTTTSGTDYNAQLQYKNSSGVWVDVVSNQVTIAAGDTFVEVKVKTLEDNVLDNGESLTLTATINGGTNTDMANTTDTGNTTVNDYASLRIDTKPYVLEGDYAVFEIGLSEIKSTDTIVTLGGSGTATMGTDYSQNYEYSTDGGATWHTISNFTVTIPGSSTEISSILVRTQTSSDGVSEPDETLTLIANTTDVNISTQSVSATTLIVEPLNITLYETKESNDDTYYDNTTTYPREIIISSNDFDYKLELNGATFTKTLGGTITDNGDGTLTYTPDSDFSGSDGFTYTRTDNVTGLEVTCSANVTVVGVADQPSISFSLTNDVIEAVDIANNGSFDNVLTGTDNSVSVIVDSNGNTLWFAQESPGASNKFATAKYTNISLATDSSGTSQMITLGTGGKETLVTQVYTIDTAKNITISFDVIDNGGTGVVSLYWIGTMGSDATVSAISGAQSLAAGHYSITVPASAMIAGQDNGLVFSGDYAGIDNISVNIVGENVITYDVNIDYSINDFVNDDTEFEFIQDTVTISGVPIGAKFTLDGATVGVNTTSNTTGTDTWTFTQSQIDGLKITVSEAIATTSPGFTLTASVTSEENVETSSHISTSTNSASITILQSDDRPEIGDINIAVANETNLTTNLTDVISTYFSTDSGNVFSWESSLANIPALYVNGQLMEFTYVGNQAFGKVGSTTYLTITATMDGTEGSTTTVTDFKVEQSTELFGLQTVTDGDIVLPGGGNLSTIVLGFETSQSDTSIAVDCLVVAHNTIEDTADEIASSTPEHTVNTNNYYIGVDSNNMNAGDQLIMDFAATGDSYTHAQQPASTSYHEVSSIVIDLFNYNSDLNVANPDLLTVTLTKVDNTTETIEILNSMLTPSYNGVTGSFYTITSSDGQAFTQVQFDAGSTSSYKLGIAAIGSISYDKDFDIQLGYSITDTDGDSDTGIATISFDGDNSITYDANDIYIDGSSGTDTLVLDNGIDIDFSTYSNTIKNIEEIDMTDTTSANVLSNIAVQDILDITDSNNSLTILGDATDSVSLDNTGGNWSTDGVTDSDGYKTYVNSGDNSVSLKIDADITVSGLI